MSETQSQVQSQENQTQEQEELIKGMYEQHF